MRHLWIAAALIGLSLSFASAALANEAVVVSDSAAFGFPRGTTLQDGAALHIPDGKTLSLVDASGKGKLVTGPFDGKLDLGGSGAPANQDVVHALRQIFTARTDIGIGATRDAGDKPQPPDPRLIDLSDSATVCVAPGDQPKLWRPGPARHVTLTLTRSSTGERGEVDWPTSAATVTWPATLPIVDGETYQAIVPGALTRPRLVVKVLAFGGPSVAEAQKLADAQCLPQAYTMLESIAASH